MLYMDNTWGLSGSTNLPKHPIHYKILLTGQTRAERMMLIAADGFPGPRYRSL